MLDPTIVKIIADGLLLPIVLIAGYVLLFKINKNDRFNAYARIIMAGLTALLIAKFLAAVYQPSTERPFELMGVAPGASYLNNPGFPSDHALFATAILLAVWFETRQKRTAFVLAFLTILVCVGRVLALVHTPLDIIGGVFAAMVGAAWYFSDSGGIEKRKLKQSKT